MRYFFSTGEASGELSAVLLAAEIRKLDPQAEFEGIGGEGMRRDGFTIWRDHAGWAGMGPLEAIPRIVPLLRAGVETARHIQRMQPDLVVLIDFGAFNLRLATVLRRIGYRKPILDLFPPAAWLDDERRARQVAAVMTPVTAFKHQRDFYQSLGLPIAYFGHPLVARVEQRPPLPAPPRNGGTVALLPGSRPVEWRYHVPRLLRAYALLKQTRPHLRGVVGAFDAAAERAVRAELKRVPAGGLDFARGTHAAIDQADAAWVASGTAVLECFLSGVPVVALYVVSPLLDRYAKRRMGRFVTLPNLVLQREVVPELLSERATPELLAETMEGVLGDTAIQYGQINGLREELGPADALERCATFAVAMAKGDAG